MGRKIIDLTGRKFGKLMVIKRDYPNQQNGHLMWLCKCECGKEKIVSGWHLKSGHTKSCGCLLGSSKRLILGLANMRGLFRTYKRSAEKRGYSFELTEEQFKDLTQQDCHYCGAKPSNLAKSLGYFGKYIYNGIDRVNNNKGYVIDNVISCCKKCNKAKGTATLREFKDWIKRVSDRVLSM